MKNNELRKTLPRSAGTLLGFLEARYFFLMCGFFATFSGFMYNDFMSIPLKLFGTCYDEHLVKTDRQCVPVAGIDPSWHQADNFLSYANSFKMKFAIIIAVVQINFGLVLSLFNNVHFDDYWTMIFTSIPRIIFYNCIFGYMMFLIVIKWVTNWDGRTPPSIVAIFTGGGVVTENDVLFGTPDGSYQEWVQKMFALTAMV